MDLSDEQCQQWLANPSINPLTGRKIKEGSSTYNRIKAQCVSKYTGEPTICDKKWRRLTFEEAMDYGHQLSVNCPCGYSKLLHIVHDEQGGYYCDRCDGTVRLINFCYRCKGVNNLDD